MNIFLPDVDYLALYATGSSFLRMASGNSHPPSHMQMGMEMLNTRNPKSLKPFAHQGLSNEGHSLRSRSLESRSQNSRPLSENHMEVDKGTAEMPGAYFGSMFRDFRIIRNLT